MKFKELLKKVLVNVPDSAKQKMQMTLISTVVCIVLQASGASVETCQTIHEIMSTVASSQ